MGHQQKRRPMLEPVLENYMGPPISYETPRKPRHGSSSAKVAPSRSCADQPGQQSKLAKSSLNPVNIFGKMRDRYIKTMNDMAMGGDYAAVAGYHGCVPGPEYPDTAVEHRRSEERKREIEALREELAALRREEA